MNTKEQFVITLSREVGSGGHTVGAILADKLNVRYCDKMLVESLEKRFGLSAGEIEDLKAKKKNWLEDFIGHVSPVPSARALSLNPSYTEEFKAEVTTNDVFKAECEILQSLAGMGSCVIAGRSGFFVFRDHPNHLNVFVKASLPVRLERVMKKQNISEEKAIKVIEEVDKARENYIRRFSGASRYDLRNYDLILTADGHTEEHLADMILAYMG